MRALILVGSLAFAAALAGCQPQVTGEPNTNSNVAVATANENISPTASGCGATSGTVKDEQALLVAETAYNVPAQAYVQLGSNLSADNHAKVRQYLIKAYGYLKLARAAYNAGDNCELNRYKDLVRATATQANGLLPK